MDQILAMTHQTGTRLAEVAFLLLLFAGLALMASRFTALRMGATRSVVVAGLLVGVAAVLLIIAAHWGHFN